MTSDQMSTSVASIEQKAEDILESARKKADDIILKARNEAKDIVSCKPPVEDFKKESQSIVQKAKDSAVKAVQNAEDEYGRIKKLAEPKVSDVSERILNIVTGVTSR
jgi:vacuolar-type H+-ATPase subunit E/Vma4